MIERIQRAALVHSRQGGRFPMDYFVTRSQFQELLQTVRGTRTFAVYRPDTTVVLNTAQGQVNVSVGQASQTPQRGVVFTPDAPVLTLRDAFFNVDRAVDTARLRGSVERNIVNPFTEVYRNLYRNSMERSPFLPSAAAEGVLYGIGVGEEPAPERVTLTDALAKHDEIARRCSHS